MTDKIFKKHHMKKTELEIILAVAIVFVAFNIVWFAWSHGAFMTETDNDC